MMYGLDLFLFYLDALMRDNVAYESYLFLVELTLFQVSIQQVLLQLL